MVHLAFQTLFWIILAAVFGIFVGWLIWNPYSKRTQREMSELRRKISNREKIIARLRENADQHRAMLNTYKKEMEDICRPSFVPPLPVTIPEARAFEADDLKKLSGLGPVLEGKLNALNIYTYEQVAALTPDMLEELEETFGSIADHLVQEDWVGQAKNFLNGRQHNHMADESKTSGGKSKK